MKKLALLLVSALMVCMLAACSNTESNTNNDQAAERDPGAIDVPAGLGAAEYVTGSWEVLASSDSAIAYNTDKSVIVVARASDDMNEAAIAALLDGTNYAGSAIELKDEPEEVEINGISGTRQGLTVSDFNGELFLYGAEGDNYALLVFYTDPANIAEAQAATDQVFSSMNLRPAL